MSRRLILLWVLVFCCGTAVAERDALVDPISGIAFVSIPEGCFAMGSAKEIQPPPDSHWENIGYTHSINEDEVPRHRVCVKSFWLGKHEVSVGEWERVMGLDPDQQSGLSVSSKNTDTAKSGVTWAQAQRFVGRLNERSGGRPVFRLPTEAEWEYACRAGTVEDILPRDVQDQQAIFDITEHEKAVPQRVGQRAANSFGLHDMLGNVWEWASDAYLPDGYAKHALYEPRVEADVSLRVLRGGSVRTERLQVRCAMRGHMDIAESSDLVGFRLVRER